MSDEVTTVEPADPAKGEPAVVDEPLREPGLKALKEERERASLEKTRADELAARLREYEDRDKSEEQKVLDRIAEAEKRAEGLELTANRATVAAASGVPVAVLAGPESGSPEHIQAFADALIAWRGAQADPAPASKSYVIPDEGGKPAIGKEDSISPGIGTLRAAYGQVK